MKNLSLLLIGLLFLSSCRDDEFDGPNTDFTNPDLVVTHTIAELKAGNILGEFDEITEDIVISGIVTADDESGNFFKEIIIQDSTGPISIALDETDVYNLYPVGRRLFIKCQGLWIGDNAGVQQLGIGEEVSGNFSNVVRIPAALIPGFIEPGALEGEPVPEEKTLSQLTTNDFNKLIRLKEVEFLAALVGQPYANAGGGGGVNQIVVDCNGSQVTMRNSDFANFAENPMPGGNGDIICIYSVFGSSPQIKIRYEVDVMLDNDACNSSAGCTDVSVADLRACYSGVEGPVASGTLVGTVISDRDGGNVNSQNLVLQDGNRGIVIRFSDPHSFNLGDNLSIETAGGTISEFNGLLQIEDIGMGAVTVTSTGNNVTPAVVTVSEILNNSENLESTLVQIEDVTLSGGSTWGDGVTVMDGTGSISVFTFFTSTLGSVAVPSTAESVLAIVSQFNDVQLNLRNPDDVDGGGIVNPPGGNEVEVSIQSIRDLWTGSGSSATVGTDQKIKGVVISDFGNGNINGQNLVIQNGNTGIVVRFTEAHSFPVGDSLEIVVSGQEVSDFNELVQINNVPISNATSLASGMPLSPQIVSIADVLGNHDSFESTLVKFTGVTISGASTFNGNTTVSDGSNDIAMFTFSGASFSGDAVPSGAVDLTGIVGDFGGIQINLRSSADIE